MLSYQIFILLATMTSDLNSKYYFKIQKTNNNKPPVSTILLEHYSLKFAWNVYCIKKQTV